MIQRTAVLRINTSSEEPTLAGACRAPAAGTARRPRPAGGRRRAGPHATRAARTRAARIPGHAEEQQLYRNADGSRIYKMDCEGKVVTYDTKSNVVLIMVIKGDRMRG